MNIIRNIISLLIVICFTNSAQAETIISTIYKNYPVSGSNIQEIRQAMLSSAPKDELGNVFTAKTAPKFTWKYNFIENAKGCRIKSTDVEVEITYQLPVLEGYTNLNDIDKAEWKRYSNATFEHEKSIPAPKIYLLKMFCLYLLLKIMKKST